MCGNTSRNKAEISLTPCFLVSRGWPFLFLWAHGGAPACSSCFLPALPWSPAPRPLLLAAGAPMLEPGQEEAAAGEGNKSHPGTCKPSSMAPCAFPDGTCPTRPCSAPWWPAVVGKPGGTPGVTREVAQVISIWIPATISVASQGLRWPGQQEKLSQHPSGRCRRQSWG